MAKLYTVAQEKVESMDVFTIGIDEEFYEF